MLLVKVRTHYDGSTRMGECVCAGLKQMCTNKMML